MCSLAPWGPIKGSTRLSQAGESWSPERQNAVFRLGRPTYLPSGDGNYIGKLLSASRLWMWGIIDQRVCTYPTSLRSPNAPLPIYPRELVPKLYSRPFHFIVIWEAVSRDGFKQYFYFCHKLFVSDLDHYDRTHMVLNYASAWFYCTPDFSLSKHRSKYLSVLVCTAFFLKLILFETSTNR